MCRANTRSNAFLPLPKFRRSPMPKRTKSYLHGIERRESVETTIKIGSAFLLLFLLFGEFRLFSPINIRFYWCFLLVERVKGIEPSFIMFSISIIPKKFNYLAERACCKYCCKSPWLLFVKQNTRPTGK